MYKFSTKTLVNKEYKVSDFLKQIKASKEIREDAKNINKIIFQNVINAKTLNILDDDKEYREIYIIRLVLNNERIPQKFIEEIDKFIKFHTYFVCEYDGYEYTEIAFKEIGTKVKISSRYYTHAFNKFEPIELPFLNKVSDVYKFLLNYETKVGLRQEETPLEYITRVKEISKLEYQISKTENAIRYESQPKKKFEYNERLREYKKQLEKCKVAKEI